ncbi:MBL fold metallo-hydrolase [archaeon]|nr:MBL fold metallo-hydrolase [archaeon]MBL7057517.1 MBL fold metallo-hydrolase [Candidatus Woesearchaeota archaeon]
MAEIKQIIVGIHDHEGETFHLSSSVTLIKTDKNVLVDTGSFLNTEEIITNLGKEGLKPEDIDIVVMTHMHIDHAVNLYLFKNAIIHYKFINTYPGQTHTPAKGQMQRFELIDGTEIAKDVSILLTPGHTNEHLSVVVKTDEGTVVVSGDALATEGDCDLEDHPPEFILWSLEAYNVSRKKILKTADYIIPGHGKMFKVSDKFK